MVYMEWESDLYDFSDPEVRLKYVPQLGCSVGGTISMLRKSWKSYKAARREGYEDRCLEKNIVSTRFKVLLGSKNVVLVR